MIKKYLLIARENIIGISDDEGLKAVDGYAEKVFEVTDEQIFTEVFEKEIKNLIAEHPNNHFETYDYKEI
ncbi:MAG: hypothetical protein IK085_08260 [Clostridia bacterium]|nr:hypothetical protein [Clostridia bacterium]